MMKHTLKHQWYDLKNNYKQFDKLETAAIAQDAPGYAEYEAGLSFTTRKASTETDASTPDAQSSMTPV